MAATPPLTPLGPLVLEARLGAGGMGVVYRARHPQYGLVCAKLLHKRLEKNEALARRFKREALAASRLDHPNIVKGFGLHDLEGRQVFLQAFVDGGDLDQARKQAGGQLAIERGLEIAIGVCEGLAAAHSAGLIHRDLKPQNVMLARDGRPLIADFGLVLSVDGEPLDGQTILTQEGQILGSPWYMSPEQIQGAHGVTGATDVYALGVMLHSLWTGRFPIGQGQLAAMSRAGNQREKLKVLGQVFEAHKSDAPIPLRQDRPDAPPELEALLLTFLEKDPARRPNAAEAAAALRALLDPGETLAEPGPDADADPLLGELVNGRYEVLALLGKGGFGAVYRARHRELGLEVALKFLDPVMARDKELKERFLREAKVLMSFVHKAAITLRDYGKHRGQPYLAMDYVEGRELKEVLAEDGPLSEDRARELAEQVLSCLEEAHATGLVHRDLKPENIMITDAGAARVLDWGIAKALGDRALELGFQQTLTQGTIGTLHYSSPEQVGGDPLDQRSDLYSLAAVLYEAVSGLKPLHADTARRLIMQIINTAPPDLAEVAEQPLSPAFVAAVMKGLEKEPEDRHADARAFSLALRAPPPIVEKTSVAPARRRRLPIPRPDKTSVAPARRSYAAWVVLAVLIALGGAGFRYRAPIQAFFSPPREDPAAIDRILADRKAWNEAAAELQDQAIQSVARKLGRAFEWVETRVYSRGEQRHRIATFKHVKTGYLMNLLPGGTYTMGSPNTEAERGSDEGPLHEVVIRKPLLIGKYEVSQKVWQSLWDGNPSTFKGEDRPVEQVSWEKVSAWVKIAGLRLPSEAEWEYACRAGSTSTFSFGDTISPEQVNYDGNYPYGNAAKGLYREKTVDVGSLPGNAFGLHEMHGNVWEWCQDWYVESYQGGPNNELPREPSGASIRVRRGGSCFNDAGGCRSASRGRDGPGSSSRSVGFRAAQGID